MENLRYSVQVVNDFVRKVYGWMFVALAISGAVAYYCASNYAIYSMLVGSQWTFFALMIAQFMTVVALSFFLPRLSFSIAAILFLFYSVLTGIMLSSVFLIYTQTSIAVSFLIAAGTFGAMALYGSMTKTDLTSTGNLSLMALFGLILAMLINLFLQNSMLDLIIACAGVIVFTLLTAYDVQKIKQLSYQAIVDTPAAQKLALLGALTLYLDLINLFLMFLRITGRRRRD